MRGAATRAERAATRLANIVTGGGGENGVVDVAVALALGREALARKSERGISRPNSSPDFARHSAQPHFTPLRPDTVGVMRMSISLYRTLKIPTECRFRSSTILCPLLPTSMPQTCASIHRYPIVPGIHREIHVEKRLPCSGPANKMA